MSAVPEHPLRAGFQNTTIDALTPTRIANIVERTQLSHKSVLRALQWTPRETDVIVASAPASGALTVCKASRMLVASQPLAASAQTATPWLESREYDVDEAPSASTGSLPFFRMSLEDVIEQGALANDQEGVTRRVFRTNQCFAALQPRLDRSLAQVVVVIRNPKDVREMCVSRLCLCVRALTASPHRYFKKLRSLTIEGLALALGASKDQVAQDFDMRFTPDEFVNVPLPILSAAELQGPPSYETFLAQFVAAQSSRLLLVHIEAFLAQPELVLAKLAEFLHVSASKQTMDEILCATTGKDMLKTDLQALDLFTLDQTRFVVWKFAFENNEDHPRRDALEQMAQHPTLVSELGVFASDTSADRVAGPNEFSISAVDKIMAKWTAHEHDLEPTYEDFYAKTWGAGYPVADRGSKRSSRRLFLNMNAAATSSPGHGLITMLMRSGRGRSDSNASSVHESPGSTSPQSPVPGKGLWRMRSRTPSKEDLDL
jgi:hypothetical protein